MNTTSTTTSLYWPVYTTSSKVNETFTLPNNNYDDTLVFTGQDKITVDMITDIIIVFLLLSVLLNFGFVVFSIVCSSKCYQKQQRGQIMTNSSSKILEKIFVRNEIEALSVDDVNYLFSQYGYINVDITGEHLLYLFNLDSVDEVYQEVQGHILKPSHADDTSLNKYLFIHQFQKMRDEYRPHTNEDMYEIIKRKLDAEISVGVLSAIIMGFSISIFKVENYRNYHDMLFNILNYVHVFIQSIVSGMSMLNVISSTTIYFQGMTIISQHHRSNRQMLEDFQSWWCQISTIRKLVRYCFIYCLPMFLLSFITNPDIWLSNIYLAIFNLIIIYASVVCGSISYCRFNFNLK